MNLNSGENTIAVKLSQFIGSSRAPVEGTYEAAQLKFNSKTNLATLALS